MQILRRPDEETPEAFTGFHGFPGTWEGNNWERRHWHRHGNRRAWSVGMDHQRIIQNDIPRHIGLGSIISLGVSGTLKRQQGIVVRINHGTYHEDGAIWVCLITNEQRPRVLKFWRHSNNTYRFSSGDYYISVAANAVAGRFRRLRRF